MSTARSDSARFGFFRISVSNFRPPGGTGKDASTFSAFNSFSEGRAALIV